MDSWGWRSGSASVWRQCRGSCCSMQGKHTEKKTLWLLLKPAPHFELRSCWYMGYTDLCLLPKKRKKRIIIIIINNDLKLQYVEEETLKSCVCVERATQRLFIKHQTVVYCVLDLVFPFDCCCVLPIRWSTETQCRCTEPFCPCEAPSHSPRAAFSSLSLHPQQTPAEWHMSLLRSKGFVSTTVQSPGLQLFSSSWQLHIRWKHL